MQIPIDFKYRVLVEDLDTGTRLIYLFPRHSSVPVVLNHEVDAALSAVLGSLGPEVVPPPPPPPPPALDVRPAPAPFDVVEVESASIACQAPKVGAADLSGFSPDGRGVLGSSVSPATLFSAKRGKE